MDENDYELVGKDYRNTSAVPKGNDLYYRCDQCGGCIRSVSTRSGGCECGNVFIDWEYFRLAVTDFGKFSVLRRITKQKN